MGLRNYKKAETTCRSPKSRPTFHNRKAGQTVKAIMVSMAMVFLLFAPAVADWSDDPDTNTPICTAERSQGYPELVSDGAGGAIITWHDSRIAGQMSIYAQRIDADGDILWPADGVVVCSVAGGQYFPQLVSDGFGGAVITWLDDRDSTRSDIYAQRVDADGDILWPADSVAICTAAGNQFDPMLTGDGAGGAIITWRDYRHSTVYSDIYAQRVDATGDTLWSLDGVVVCADTMDQWLPRLIGDGSEGAIITWQDYRSGTNFDIYARRVEADGDLAWSSDGVAVCTATGDQWAPIMIGDGAGGAIIAWMDDRNTTTSDIYAQRVDANGSTQWSDNGVAICTATDNQWNHQLIGDGSGGAIITWEDYRDSTKSDIYAQRIDADGDTLWPADGVAVCTVSGHKNYPRLIGDGSGGAIITWEDYRDTTKSDIYAQRIDADGDTQWPAAGVAVCTATDMQSFPRLIGGGSGGAIITWQDDRSGEVSTDIYAQRVNHNGTLGGDPPPAGIGDLTVSVAAEDLVLMWPPVTVDTSGAPLAVDLYRIYRDTVAGFEPGSAPFDSTLDTSYVDTSGVVGETGTQYFYAVTAVDGGRESVPSEQVGEFDREVSSAP